MERKAFLDQEPPPGYVPGVGRGASGFTTSADTGPMNFESEFGTEATDAQPGILSHTSSTAEDEEADRIYEEIERRIQGRHKEKTKHDDASLEKVNIPTGAGVIQHLFTDLKSELGKVTMDEWENLPSVGDLTRKNKRQRLLDQQSQRSYAAPDALIASTGTGNSHVPATNPEGSVKLSDIEDWESSHASLGDVDKGRQILASLRRTQPHKADSWISSARLEEQAKNWKLAKAYIKQGCNAVPHAASVWLESVRLHRSDGVAVCKTLMNEALRLNSKCEELWLAAVQLENPADVFSQKKVLMKALEFLPSNSSLWKELVKIEDDVEDKRRLLSKATELCPGEWDFWIGVINLSSYAESKAYLNKARRSIPQEIKVWTTALKLEERENPGVSTKKLSQMVNKGAAELSKNGAQIPAEKWLQEAVLAQKEDFSKSSQAIVYLAMEPETSTGEIEPDSEAQINGKFAMAENPSNAPILRHIRTYLSERFPQNEANWRALFSLLKTTDRPRLYEAYEKAISLNPNSVLFYLMCAKDQWILEGDVDTARRTLQKASDENTQNEEIWAARIKLEIRTRSFDQALQISNLSLRDVGDSSPRMWYKHIHLLRYCRFKKILSVNDDTLKSASEEAFRLHSDNERVILQRAQVLVDVSEPKAARETLSAGSRICPQSVAIWTSLADLDSALSAPARARSLLDTALLDLSDAKLWECRINLELSNQDMVSARQLINRSLKLFPESPELWLLYLQMIPKMAHRKNGFLDALKKTNNSTEVLLGIGVFFWLDGKFAKARAWFERSLASDKENGEAWAWMYCYHNKHGAEEDISKLISELENNFDNINKGRTWIAVVKDPRNLDKSPEACIKIVADQLLATRV